VLARIRTRGTDNRKDGPTIRRIPRSRRQIGPATLRVARAFGFRYDDVRHAYVLRGVGNRFGPVLRSGPPIDSAAAQMEWSDSMDELAARRRKTGRFTRDPQVTPASERNLLRR